MNAVLIALFVVDASVRLHEDVMMNRMLSRCSNQLCMCFVQVDMRVEMQYVMR